MRRQVYRGRAGRDLVASLEGRLLMSATPLSATAAQRAIASYNAMQAYLYRHDATNLYHEQYPVLSTDQPYSYLWPLSQAYNATLDMSNVAANSADVAMRVSALADYYSSSGQAPNKSVSTNRQPSPPGYDSYVDSPLGGGGDKYYDDNAWVGLASMQQYAQTGDASALTRAQTIFNLIAAGWDSSASDPDAGGVFWTQASSSQDRNTVSNMPAAELGLRLFIATRNAADLDWATRMYNWTYAYMRDPSDGLFWDHVNLAGQVNQAKWTYNQGTPIGANVLFYQITGNPTYLQRAQQIASASLAHWSGSATESRNAERSIEFNRPASHCVRSTLVVITPRRGSGAPGTRRWRPGGQTGFASAASHPAAGLRRHRSAASSAGASPASGPAGPAGD